jgi:hypothetical protein
MQQQEQHSMVENWRRNFNIAYSLLLIHQRGIIIPMRERFGKDVFGFHCVLALVLMCLWAAFSKDMFMWLWIGLWVLYLAKRRDEAARLAKDGKTHSQYDGWPAEAIKLGRTEKAAKLVVEPVLVGIVGGILFWIYQEAGLPVYGLPYFFLAGVFTLPFVERVKQIIWERRVQGMTDARIEQEALVRDVRERTGGD